MKHLLLVAEELREACLESVDCWPLSVSTYDSLTIHDKHEVVVWRYADQKEYGFNPGQPWERDFDKRSIAIVDGGTGQ